MAHLSYVFLALTHRHGLGMMTSWHYTDVLMNAMASQITSLTIVFSTVYSRCRSKETLKLRVTVLCVGNSPVTCEFPAQRASNAENVSIWWRHHGMEMLSAWLTGASMEEYIAMFFVWLYLSTYNKTYSPFKFPGTHFQENCFAIILCKGMSFTYPI